MRFRETKFWRRGQKGLLLALLVLIVKMGDDLWEDYERYVPDTPYRPLCYPSTEEFIHGEAPKKRYLDGELDPRFRALLLENVQRLYWEGDPRYRAHYLVLGGRIMVPKAETSGGGGFGEAQWQVIEKLAKAWYFPPGEVREGIPDHVRLLVESLLNERGLVDDLFDCRLVKAVAIDGW